MHTISFTPLSHCIFAFQFRRRADWWVTPIGVVLAGGVFEGSSFRDHSTNRRRKLSAAMITCHYDRCLLHRQPPLTPLYARNQLVKCRRSLRPSAAADLRSLSHHSPLSAVEVESILSRPESVGPDKLMEALAVHIASGGFKAPTSSKVTSQSSDAARGAVFDTSCLHVIAYSGGVDSSLTAYLVHKVFGSQAVACLGLSPSLSIEQLQQARQVAQHIGIQLWEVPTNEQQLPGYMANDGEACFHCKTTLYSTLQSVALAGADKVSRIQGSYSSSSVDEVTSSGSPSTQPLSTSPAGSNDTAAAQECSTETQPSYLQAFTSDSMVIYNGTNADDLKDPTRLGLIAAANYKVRYCCCLPVAALKIATAMLTDECLLLHLLTTGAAYGNEDLCNALYTWLYNSAADGSSSFLSQLQSPCFL